MRRGAIYRWVGGIIGLGTTLGLFVIQFGVERLPILLALAAVVVGVGYALIMLLSRRRRGTGTRATFEQSS